MTFVLFINILTAHICEMKNSAGVALIGYLWHPRLFCFFWFSNVVQSVTLPFILPVCVIHTVYDVRLMFWLILVLT